VLCCGFKKRSRITISPLKLYKGTNTKSRPKGGALELF
jgi:hypothetical protein